MRYLPFEVQFAEADIDEDAVQAPNESRDPHELAWTISAAKGTALISRFPDSIIITADTLVMYEGRSLGKPKSTADNVRMLEALAGGVHQVVTGVSVTTPDGQLSQAIETAVMMQRSPAHDIEQYSQSRDGMDKAGGYGIQGPASRFVQRVDGCYLNVVGFPLCLVSTLLSHAGTGEHPNSVALCSQVTEFYLDQSKVDHIPELSSHP